MPLRLFIFCCVLCATPGPRASGGGATRSDSTEYERLYESLMHLSADETNIAPVANVVLRRDVGTFSLEKGQVMLCKPVMGRVIAALFVGEGVFSMTPPFEVERKQLYRFYEADSIRQPFKTLFLLFTDSTLADLHRVLKFARGEVPNSAEGTIADCLRYVSDDDAVYFDTHLVQAFLDRRPSRMFYAHLSESRGNPFFFQIDPYEEEDVRFGQRYDERFTHWRETVSQFPGQGASKNGGTDVQTDLIRISDYQIQSTIDDDLDFAATATLTLTSLIDSLRWIPLSLFSELKVDTCVWNNAIAARFVQHEHNGVLWIQTAHALSKSERDTLTVSYKGELLTRDELGWIGLKSPEVWYPRYGYRLHADFDLMFHTPARWKFASVGKQLSMNQVGDTLVSHWLTVNPTHNVSFSIGNFEEVPPSDDEVSAEKKTGESLPNVTVFTLESIRRVGDARLEDDVRGDMLNSMRFFQHVYGPSPVADFYATEIPYSHGEAFPGLIHLSWATYKVSDREGSNEIFRAHEVAHQWWGVGVNFRTYHDQWLSEGFATYSGIWYMQTVLKNNKKFFDVLDSWGETILGNRHYLLGSGQEAGPIWLGYRTQSSNTQGDYNLIVYKKGAWVLHMLRNMMIDLQTMNEDRFKNMMREFFSTYLGKEASTADFQRMVEKHMGMDMTWFFNEWIMDTPIPTYEFAYHTEKTEEGKFKVVCRVNQKNVPKEFRMYVPLLIKFDGDRHARVRVLVSGENPEFELPLLPLEPEEIVFNDLRSVLCEVENVDWK